MTLFETKDVFLKDLLKYRISDKNLKVIGQIDDFFLSKKDLSISKFIIYGIFGHEAFIIGIEELEAEEEQNLILITSISQPNIQIEKIHQFSNIFPELVLYSNLQKFKILDINHSVNPHGFVDLVIKGIKTKSSFIILLKNGFLIRESNIRFIKNNIELNTSNSDLDQIISLPEESIHKLLSNPMEALDNFNLEQPDWSMIDQLIELGFSESAKSFLLNLNHSELQITNLSPFYFYLGKSHYALGDHESAIKLFKQSISQSTSKQDEILLGRGYIQLGKVYVSLGKLDEAFQVLQQALNLLENNYSYSQYRTIALNWIGRVHYLNGRSKEALKIFNLALSLSTHFDSPKTVALSLSNLGIIYRGQGNFEKSLECFKKGRNILRGNYPLTLTNLIINEAITYFELGQQGKSLETHYDALSIREKIGNSGIAAIGIADSVLNIIRIEHSMGKLSSTTIEHFPESGNDNIPLITAYKHIIDGIKAKEASQWNKAIQFWRSALSEPSLDFSYQVWISEYIGEVLILKWKDDHDTKSLDDLNYGLKQAQKLCIKNDLYSHLCKTNLLISKLAMITYNFDLADSVLRKTLEISINHNLPVHQALTQQELDLMPLIKAKIHTIDFEEYIKKWLQQLLLYVRNLRVLYLF